MKRWRVSSRRISHFSRSDIKTPGWMRANSRERIAPLNCDFPIVTRLCTPRQPRTELLSVYYFLYLSAQCLSVTSRSPPSGGTERWAVDRRVPSKPTGFQSFSLHVYGFTLADCACPRGLQVGGCVRLVSSYKISWSCTIAAPSSAFPHRHRSFVPCCSAVEDP